MLFFFVCFSSCFCFLIASLVTPCTYFFLKKVAYLLATVVRAFQTACWQYSTSNVSPLKCLWSEIFYYLIWQSFQNDEEWRLFYCDSTLGCRVIQDFDLCKLNDLWCHFVDTKWCKITKYGISVQVLSLQGWNFAGLMCCKNYTLWLWCHHSNILVTRPLPY